MDSEAKVHADLGHFVVRLRALGGTEVSNYHLESDVKASCFSYICDRSQSSNKSGHISKDNLSSQVLSRIIDYSKPLVTSGNRSNPSPMMRRRRRALQELLSLTIKVIVRLLLPVIGTN